MPPSVERFLLHEPCNRWYLRPFACLYALSQPGFGHLKGFSTESLSTLSPFVELMRSRLAGGCDVPPIEGKALMAGCPTVVAFAPTALDEPGVGKKRFGGAHAGKWLSPLPGRRERDENADRPLLLKAKSLVSSPSGVPGMELPGVENGEFAE